MLRHGSLFSGIGGFDLAVTWMGWENVFMCELDGFCRNVLKHYWPNADWYEDVRTFSAVKYRGLVDIVSGGFPCQPFSQAGRRKGKRDDRYLWPEARRIITEIRPQWIVLENVAGLFTILEPAGVSAMEVKTVELFCKDETYPADEIIVRLQRRVIGTIIQEISSAGYVLPQLADGTPVLLCIPACAVNAPHRRDRVWFVAHAQYPTDRQTQDGCAGYDSGCKAGEKGKEKATVHKGRADSEPAEKEYSRRSTGAGCTGVDGHATTGRVGVGTGFGIVADAGSQGLEGNTGKREPGFSGRVARYDKIPGWDEWPTQSAVLGGNDGLPARLDGITLPRWRTESIKGFGNAIVPQLALEIFRIIQQIEYHAGRNRSF